MVLASAAPGLAQEQRPVARVMPQPQYPYEMSRAGIPGWVKVEFVIDAKGEVISAKVAQSSHREFEKAALAAISKWRFVPGKKDGKAVNVRATQVLEFNLDTFAVYPRELLLNGVEGQATVRYSVDDKGRAIGVVAVKATHPEFAAAARAAIMAGDYAAGLPVDETRERIFSFLANGRGDAIVSAEVKKLLAQLRKQPEIIRASELDQRPEVKIHPPVRIAPDVLASAGPGSARVAIFIDDEGNVLLPQVISATNEDYGYAVAQAVAGWKYEPPKKGGKRVLAQAAVEVSFGSK